MRRLLMTITFALALCGGARAQTTISALPSATPAAADAVPFVTMGTTPKVTKRTTLADFFSVLQPSHVASGNKQGGGSKFQLFGGGSVATNDCAKFDASGNVVSNGGTCAAAAPVQSVFGRAGNVVAAANDYNFNQLAGSLACSQRPALTGDVTASAGSCATTLSSVVTAGTNTKLTYDAKGRVTAGSQAQFSDIGGTAAASQLPASVPLKTTGTTTIANGATYDIAVAAHAAYLYAVFDQNDRTYFATGIAISDASFINQGSNTNGGGLTMTNNSLNLRISNATGGSRTVNWTLTKIY